MPSSYYLETKHADGSKTWKCAIFFDRLKRERPAVYSKGVQWYLDQGRAENFVEAEKLFRASGKEYGCCGLPYHPFKDGPSCLLEFWSKEEQTWFSLVGDLRFFGDILSGDDDIESMSLPALI